MISLFRKKISAAQSPANAGLDDITQTLAVPLLDLNTPIPCVARSWAAGPLEIASYSSVGTRHSQQDSIRFDGNELCAVCAVCDGMGGLSGGERASALAAEGIVQSLMEHSQAESIPLEMGRSAFRLNEKVKDLRDDKDQKIEAGTTLTTIFIRDGSLFWCSIGDSHIYLFRQEQLEQLNIDHNLGVQLDQMVQDGALTAEEARSHPQREALTSYLGIRELTRISGNQNPIPLQKGDILLQCTDGLYRSLNAQELAEILNSTDQLDDAAKCLVETALCLPGSHDNTSVALTRFNGTEA